MKHRRSQARTCRGDRWARTRAFGPGLRPTILALCVVLSWIDPSCSLAADGAAASSTPEEIVITAERKPEALLDVPIAVTVLTSADLRRAAVESTTDLSLLAPSLQFFQNTVIVQPYLRGVGSDLLSAGVEGSVATYVDDVYRARPASSVVQLFDVDRVEILKGPQGTLFGRNATGGVVHIVHRRPSDHVEAGGDLLYGSFDELRMRGAVNLPVLDGRVRTRLAALGSWRDGFSDNQFLGDRLDNQNYVAVRGQLEADLTTDLTLLVSGDYARERDSRGLAAKLIAPLSGSPAVAMGGTVPPGPRDVFYNIRPRVDLEDWGVAARLEWNPGALDAVAVSAWRSFRFAESVDVDGTEIPLLQNDPFERSDVFTQEIRVGSSVGDRLTWLAGVYYLHEDARQNFFVTAPFAAPGGVVDDTQASLRSDSVAVFGDLTYSLHSDVRIVGGLRYTYDHRSEDFRELVNGRVTEAFDLSDDWSALTPRFVLEWTPWSTGVVYGSATRGYKAGGFNSAVAQPFPFDPEFVWAYELGAKGSTWNDRVQLQAAAFYYDWRDIQLSVLDPAVSNLFPVIKNAGSAEVFGLELAADAELLSGLRMGARLTLLEATFEDLNSIDPNDLDGDPNQSGNRLPRAPDASFSLYASYAVALSEYGSLVPSLDYHFQSRTFLSTFEDPTVAQDAFGVLGVRLEYALPDGRFYLAGFARNLTNQLYALNKIRLDGQIGNLAFWGAPRTYGLEVGMRL